MLRLAFDFIITWRETRTRPNAYVVNDETGEETIYNTNMKRNRMALSTCYQTHRLTCRGGNICGEKMVVSTAEFFML